jgi:hypothetical protein
MPKADTHSKILTKCAGEILKPLGVFQKGRSRTWNDDQGWWIGHVEFQPSSWSKGSYLNVGVMWLWNAKDYYSFDVGSRVANFVQYVNDDQFAKKSSQFARLAADEIIKYRKMFGTVDEAASYLAEHAIPGSPWSLLHAAIACGYVGRVSAAHDYFKQLRQQAPEAPWERDLQARASELSSVLGDQKGFRSQVDQTILAARRLLKLPEIEKLVLTRTEIPSSATP